MTSTDWISYIYNAILRATTKKPVQKIHSKYIGKLQWSSKICLSNPGEGKKKNQRHKKERSNRNKKYNSELKSQHINNYTSWNCSKLNKRIGIMNKQT